jgi:hypothetical protein
MKAISQGRSDESLNAKFNVQMGEKRMCITIAAKILKIT